METAKKVVLRHIKIPEEDREHYMSAEFRENGDLFFSAWDVCQAAKDFTGDSEYEYEIIIKKEDLPILRNAFYLPVGKDILEFLYENFSGEKSFEFERLLKERNVPNDLDIW